MQRADFMEEFNENFMSYPPKIQSQIQDTVDAICNKPYQNTKKMQGPAFSGKREGRSGKYRLSIMICNDCLEEKRNSEILCNDCGSHRIGYIRFFTVYYRKKGHKKEADRQGKIRKKQKPTIYTPKTPEEREKRKKSRKRK